jgi:Sugar phosphate isomerases/epimerases
MRLGIFARTFAGRDPSTVLQAARVAGYATVQYNFACSGLQSMPEFVPDEIANAVRIASADSDMTIAAVSATYNMIHPNPEVRRRGLVGLRAIARAAPAIGTRLLTLCTGTRDSEDPWRKHPDNVTPAAWHDLVESLNAALDIAEEYEIDLGIEPEVANVIDSAVRARRLIDELQSARLKIVLDPANLFESGSRSTTRACVSQACDLLADRIVMGHAKDRYADGRFATAGKGVLDYPHYIKCLRSIGFTGPLVTHGLRAEEAPEVAAFLHSVIREVGDGVMA